MIILSNIEKDTIFNYNEAEKTAHCFTYNKKLIRQLVELASNRPDECQLVGDNGNGGLTYRIPKKWVKIKPSRILSDETRAAMRERMLDVLNNSRSEKNQA